MKRPVAPLDPAKMTAMLRDGVLALKPEDIGFTASECPNLWGLMVEIGYSEVSASLVVLSDGSVSIYLSDGTGVIGCGLHSDVRTAALRMLEGACPMAADAKPVKDYPPPQENEVRFYFLTKQGVQSSCARRAVLDEGGIELAEVYYAAHGVIGLIELLGAGVDLSDELQFARSAVLAANATQAALENTDEVLLHSRGRGCRILPYAGNAVRRSQH
jgi:hypothetical protein